MAGKKQEPKQEESGAMVVPDYLKGVQSNASEMTAGINSSVPRISLKGRMFRFIVGGEEIEKSNGPEKFVILGVEPQAGMSHTFYLNKYQPNSSDPPDCSSWDGIRPDSWVSSKQSTLCVDCKQNQWGSATSMSGKKAKACKESKRLIVVKADDLEGQYFLLNVTISSLKSLSSYGQFLNKNRLPFSAVVTEVSIVDSDFPQVEFKFDGFLDETEGKAMISRSTEREWEGVIQSTPQLPENTNQPAQPTSQQEAPAPSAPAPADAQDVSNLVDNW